jgi:hypothetical protein
MEEASYELEFFSWIGQHSAGAKGTPKRSLAVRVSSFALPACSLIDICSFLRATCSTPAILSCLAIWADMKRRASSSNSKRGHIWLFVRRTIQLDGSLSLRSLESSKALVLWDSEYIEYALTESKGGRVSS